jgi:hypothetical protein
MKTADWLLCRDRIVVTRSRPNPSNLEQFQQCELRINGRGPYLGSVEKECHALASASVQDSSHAKNECSMFAGVKRSGRQRLRGRIRVRDNAEASVQNGDSSPIGNRKSVEPQRRIRIRIGQIEFPTAVETDSVGAVLDGEHSAHVFMPATKYKLEDSEQPVHKSCARCRRSQLPLVSSHLRSERTLARASAMAQSAAP